MKTQEKNFDGIKLSGFTAILIMLALTGTAIYLLSLPQTPSIIAGVICGICVVVMLPGFMIIQPNNSRVLTFFGRYAGTVISNGFYWVNPLFLKSTVTLRILNLNIDPIKVNDKVGNPIMIGAVVVWRIKDTYKASFDISGNIREFVQIQSDESGEITQRLEDELNSRLAIAGIEIVEARINYLAYASEIASVMLRRQQADAIISARERIVEGAVIMVHLALEKLEKDGVVELDEERKAAMVSNLLVVLCADESAQPVVNTGTLYQ